MSMNLDAFLVVAFLFITLYVGLQHSKGIKTIQDYALGGRHFSTFALVSTIIATWVSGSGFFIILSEMYTNGFYYLLPNMWIIVYFLIYSFVFIPRFGIFSGKLSVAEALGDIYGKQVRVIVAVSSIICALGYLAVQFKAFGNVFSYFTYVPNYSAVIISGVIVTLYSAFGGIRGVTFTDILQFAAFSIAISFIGVMIWDQIYAENIDIRAAFRTDNFDLKQIFDFKNKKILATLPLMLYFMIPDFSPAMFQRMSMGRDISQIKTAFIIVGVLAITAELLTAWIPFLIYNVNPNLEPKQLLGFIIDNYTVTGLKGLLVICVIAMAMSTADSHINVTSTTIVHDLLKFLKFTTQREILLLRIVAVLLGIFGICATFLSDNLLGMILITKNFYIPIVTAPIMVTLLGFRTSTKSILIGMGAGFSTVLLSYIFKIQLSILFVAMGVNLLFLLGSHYLLRQEGGWTHTKCEFIEHERRERKRKFREFIKSVKNFNFFTFCRENAPDNPMAYTWFGLYCTIYALTMMYLTHEHLRALDAQIVLHSYQVMLITGTLIALYPIWPIKVEQRIRESIVKTWWYLAVFYMMFFFSTFFVIITNLSPVAAMFFVMNVLFAVTLIGWKLSAIMLITGIYLAVGFYKYVVGIDSLNIDIGSPVSAFVYTSAILISFVIIFIKKYQDDKALLAAKNIYLSNKVQEQRDEVAKSVEIKNEFLRNIPHESHTPLTSILGFGRILNNEYDTFTEQQRREYIGYIAKSSQELCALVDNVFDLSKLTSDTFTLNKEQFSFSDLVHESLQESKKLHIDSNKPDNRTWQLLIEENVVIYADRYYLSHTLNNLIANAIQFCNSGKITITLEQEYLIKKPDFEQAFVTFSISDEGIGIPENELIEVFEPFTTSSQNRERSGGRGIGLTIAQKVIKLHDGHIYVRNNRGKGVTFWFTLVV